MSSTLGDGPSGPAAGGVGGGFWAWIGTIFAESGRTSARGTNVERGWPGAWAEAVAPTTRLTAKARLYPLRFGVLFAGTVVRGFLRNENVMRMALLNRRGADLDEPGPRAQLLEGLRSAIPHP